MKRLGGWPTLEEIIIAVVIVAFVSSRFDGFLLQIAVMVMMCAALGFIVGFVRGILDDRERRRER